MCYQEVRWHVICNHTVQSRIECPKHCAQQHVAIDSVETQLTAYCHACRLHVDSLGMARRRRHRASSSLSTMSSMSSRHPAGTVKAAAAAAADANLRLAPGSPTPSVASLPKKSSSARSSLLGGIARRSLSNGSAKAVSFGGILESPVGQEQEQKMYTWTSRPTKLEPVSPTPQKPRLSLCIPELVPERLNIPRRNVNTYHAALIRPESQPEDPTTTPSAVPLISPITVTDLITTTTITTTTTTTAEAADSMTPVSPVSPRTPRTPSSISASLEEAPSKPPSAPLPALPPAASTSKPPVGISLLDIRDSLRKGSCSSSRLSGLSVSSSNDSVTRDFDPGTGGSGTDNNQSAAIITHEEVTTGDNHASLAATSQELVTAKDTSVDVEEHPLLDAPPSPPPLVPPMSPLRRSRNAQSSVMLAESTSLSHRASLQDWKANFAHPAAMTSTTMMTTTTTTTTTLTTSVMDRPRPWPRGGAANYFRPSNKLNHGGSSAGKTSSKIDIHDPDWLAKHGLKWNVHGIGVLNSAN